MSSGTEASLWRRTDIDGFERNIGGSDHLVVEMGD